MLFHTHLLLGVVMFLLFKQYLIGNEIIIFLLVLLGSVLPDIDEYNSRIRKWSGIFGSIVTIFVKHRGIFHSLLFALILFGGVGWFWEWNYGLGLLLGYISHLVGDTLTPMGVQIFYPFYKFKLRGPIKVGSLGEILVLVGLVVLIIREFL